MRSISARDISPTEKNKDAKEVTNQKHKEIEAQGARRGNEHEDE